MNPRSYESYSELVEIVGSPLAQRLSIHLGGQRYWLGNERSAHPDLLSYLGKETAIDLAWRYSKPVLTVPVVGRILARNQMIILLSGSYSVRAIAHHLKISERSVYGIIRSADVSNQGIGGDHSRETG